MVALFTHLLLLQLKVFCFYFDFIVHTFMKYLSYIVFISSRFIKQFYFYSFISLEVSISRKNSNKRGNR